MQQYTKSVPAYIGTWLARWRFAAGVRSDPEFESGPLVDLGFSIDDVVFYLQFYVQPYTTITSGLYKYYISNAQLWQWSIKARSFSLEMGGVFFVVAII